MDNTASNKISVAVLAAHEVVRAGLKHMFDDGTGLNIVSEASNTDHAVSMIASKRPHVVLVDPDSDEITLDAIWELNNAGAGRVLVLTAELDAKGHQRAVELGASGVVMKSQPAEILVRAVHKVHSGEVWLDRVKTANVLRGILRPRDPEDAKIQSITKREREIIHLVGQGLKNAAIGQRLFISEATVRNHLTSILSKLEVSDKFELVVYAFHHNLITTKTREPYQFTSVRLASDARIRAREAG